MNKSKDQKRESISIIKILKHFFFQFENDQEKEVTVQEGLRSLKYHYKNLHDWTPKLFYMGILRVIPDLVLPVFTIVLPTMVVKGLEQKWDADKFAYYIGGLMIIMILFHLINARILTILTEEKDSYRFRYLIKLCNKKMDIDYDILESQEFQNRQRLAFHWIVEWANGPMERCISSPGAIGACLIGMLIYGVILAKQSVMILVLIAISVLITVAMSARALRYEDAMWGKTSKIRRKMGYINNQAMDFTAGKDIRLYGMQKWFLNMYRKLLKENENYLSELQWQYSFESGTDALMVFIRDALAYSYLIYQIANGRLTVSDFVLYTSLVTGFSTWFRKGVEEMQWLVRGGYAFHAVKECLNISNHWKTNEEKVNNPSNSEREALSIELKNVSFTYTGKEKPTIKNINMKINKGEKLALVGLNGAGKTSLVKLLCGFYQPTEGEILVNGIPIKEYDREEYYSMISAVFQDTQILPVTISENISAQRLELSKISRVKECLKLSGLSEKTDKLEKGENTLLVRELSSNAIDLSGGEKQKLLLSRALYKEAGFLILDEPTAALDPIAENDIYLKYKELTEGKTSLFISHRLSSTRFCDRIILLQDGQIVEEGTHETLMGAGGQYAYMFEVQSRYYREEEEEKRRRGEGDLSYV